MVSGAPGSGKSTLAEMLANDLHLPLVMKDMLKESLADDLGAPTLEDGERLSKASFNVLGKVARQVLLAGGGIVIEADFFGPIAEGVVRPLLPLSSPVLLHCHAGVEVAVERYKARFREGRRHFVHHDQEVIGALDDPEIAKSWNESKPLNIGILSLVVDTTEQYNPPAENIVRFVRETVGVEAD